MLFDVIAEETINEIKERASLLEIVGEVVALRRTGSSFTGLCPFHSEKSPSFHVREEQGYFHCFGCGESGNLFKFIMETKGLSFPDAVRDLADRYGIRIKEVGRPVSQAVQNSKDVFFKINHLALHYFRSQLDKAPPLVKSYAETTRGISSEMIAAYGVGFAPSSWNGITQFLLGQKVPEELLLQSGLVRRSDRGELYDVFRSRLMFPVWVDTKRIAGFGGRIIPTLLDPTKDTEPPKYLNSPETPVYQKSKILYGLPHALPHIKRASRVYLVEGYLDVVGLYQAGVCNVVATCGTALTDLHVKRLGTIVSRVTLLFDGDDAGRAAAGKVFPLFLNSGIDVSVIFLPSDEDPDSIALKFKQQTNAYLESLPARTLFDCYLEYLVEGRGGKEVRTLGPAQRGALAEDLMEVLSRIENPVEREEYLDRTSVTLRTDKKTLDALMKRAGGAQKEGPKARDSISTPQDELELPESPSQTSTEIAALPKLDQEILLIAMGEREKFPERILRDSNLCEELSPVTLGFLQHLQELVADKSLVEDIKKFRVKELLSLYGESWLAHWSKAFSMRKDLSVNFENFFTGCLRSLRRDKLSRVLRELEREASTTSSEDEKLRISSEIISVRRKMAEATIRV